MAVEIPRFLQTKAYSALQLRRALAGMPIQAGVIDALDLDVTQRAAGGANMSVDVAAGSAWVKGTFTARQGMYHVYNDAVANLTIAANASGNPRIDQIVARVYDSIDGGNAQDTGTIEVVQGTATAGATLDNRSGAAALPGTSIRLADVLVANGAASITNANIRDRRPWARGAYTLITRNANAGGTDDYTSTTGSYIAVDATNLAPRIECSGVPLLIALHGSVVQSGATASITVYMDGVDLNVQQDHQASGSFAHGGTLLSVPYIPSAGSHKFELRWHRGGAGTVTLRASASKPAIFTIMEELRQNASND